MSQQGQTNFFYEIFDASLLRLGPGEDATTRIAFELLYADGTGNEKSDSLRILEVGCGTGAQTIQLAKNTAGEITALDNHKPFLDELRCRAEREKITDRIRFCLRDMSEPEFEEGSFDLIWSEGALSSMGFHEALALYRGLLAPGGRMAVSDLTWFKPDPPDECQAYFDSTYPAITDVEEHMAAMKSCGFSVLGHFLMPESAWLENFYDPLASRLVMLRDKYPGDAEKLDLIEKVEYEIEIYQKYSNWYGYAFFLLQNG
jgi:ubiquinone/menaquinone biosynthesis C-methylase UbiE